MEKNINEYIDHTLLKRDVLTKEIDQAINDAIKYKFKGLCIAPFWVSHVQEKLHKNNVLVVTVIGFPYGQQSARTKAFEAKQAIKDGADELDFIINASKLHEKDQDYLRKELALLRKITKNKIIKLIIETGLLNKEEKELATKLGVEAGFNFIKTSTAVNTSGATVEDVKLMKKIIDGRAKIKASGGIRTLNQAEELIKAGADRLGTSNGIDIVKGLEGKSSY
ncbi:deoxyribose-phosphate aldolase [Candidatus Hepatoplasma crinochetorum]|uniref:Deoxyribose-phosphate aldolase n=1 Tax=Candidatus Hepatoplasma crinochetorum Av TaxID=1427984 RepID=W8GNH0_9MOLU|nr:deoxyribose-phosphate aldolase [Candidatus Hepatoplasma crinochetorum]AHK22571.1 Deoxyribose-phosphate aldolase 1 [Candidatus Hepatoplasma crinochetorum Av]BDV03154.1 MAG: deoxyribose-phosphate aldolase 1 [Candidatus Hepatoplasma crinochetorum]